MAQRLGDGAIACWLRPNIPMTGIIFLCFLSGRYMGLSHIDFNPK